MIWRYLSEKTTVPILGGLLRGKRWPLVSRCAYITGRYEPHQLVPFGEALRPGGVVFDIGAHWGYFTLLASEKVGPTGTVVAFEPSPHNLIRLRRTIEANRCRNVRVMELAVTDKEGTALLETHTRSRAFYISETGQLPVRTSSLDHLIASGEVPVPEVMKVDVEGAELLLLEGALRLLREGRPVILLATHPYFRTREPCLELLSAAGYECIPLSREGMKDPAHFMARPRN